MNRLIHADTAMDDDPINQIKTIPEQSIVDRRERGAMAASVGLIAVPWTGLFGFIRSLFKGLGGKIAIAVLASAIWGSIKEAPAIVRCIRWGISLISVMAEPKATTIFRNALDRGGEVVQQQAAPAEGDAPQTTFVQKAKTFGKKTGDQVKKGVSEAAHDVEKKAKPLTDNADAAFKKIINAPAQQNFQPPPKDYVAPPVEPGSPATIGYYTQARPITPPSGWDQAKAGARNLGDGVVKVTGAFAARQAEAAAEYQIYLRWWGEACPFNGMCVNPRCRKPMKIGKLTNASFACKSCGSQARGGAIRAMGTPPPPSTKPAQFYAWKEEREKKQAEKKETP